MVWLWWVILWGYLVYRLVGLGWFGVFYRFIILDNFVNENGNLYNGESIYNLWYFFFVCFEYVEFVEVYFVVFLLFGLIWGIIDVVVCFGIFGFVLKGNIFLIWFCFVMILIWCVVVGVWLSNVGCVGSWCGIFRVYGVGVVVEDCVEWWWFCLLLFLFIGMWRIRGRVIWMIWGCGCGIWWWSVCWVVMGCWWGRVVGGWLLVFVVIVVCCYDVVEY